MADDDASPRIMKTVVYERFGPPMCLRCATFERRRRVMTRYLVTTACCRVPQQRPDSERPSSAPRAAGRRGGSR